MECLDCRGSSHIGPTAGLQWGFSSMPWQTTAAAAGCQPLLPIAVGHRVQVAAHLVRLQSSL